MSDLLLPADFQLLFEATPHPYLILRPDKVFTILAVNERYLAATGTVRSAVVGHGLFEIFPDNPYDRSGSGVSDLRASLNRVVTDGRPDVMGVQRYDIPRRDGSGDFEIKYWSPINTPVFSSTGDLLFLIHHVEDITEFILNRERAHQESVEQVSKVEARAERSEAEVLHRAAEVKGANRALKTAMAELEKREAGLARLNEQLQEQDRLKNVSLAQVLHRLDAHMENSPLAIVEFDTEFRVTRWSGIAEHLFGWRAQEIVGRAIPEVPWVFEEDMEKVARVSAEMLSGASPRNKNSNRNYRKDGSIVHCEWYNSAIYDGQGKLVSVLSQVLDVTDRVRFEAQLQASEEKYRTLFANMTEGFGLGEPILDEQGQPVDLRYLEINDAFYRQTGVSQGILGRPLREFLPQVEQVWIDRLAAVAQTGQPDRFDDYNADTHRHYDVHAFCPSPGKFAVLFRDITKKKMNEQALLENRHRLALAMRAGGSAAWELDVASERVIPLDDQLYAMVGYAPEELARFPDWLSRIHEEDRPVVTRNLAEVIEGRRECYRQEFRMRRQDGNWHWLLSLGLAVEREAQGRATRLIGTHSDIDARKRTEERLKESEEKYRALFTNMTEGVVLGEPVLDAEGQTIDVRYLEVNEAFYAHTGMPRGIAGRRLREYLPQMEQEWIDRYAAVALTGREDHFQRYNIDTHRYYDVRVFSPSPGRFAVLFRDITDRQAAEKERERLNAELENRVEERTAELEHSNEALLHTNTELRHFAHAAAHDLKTPLRSIVSFAQLLQQSVQGSQNEQAQEYSSLVIDNTKRLQALIEDLLAYTRLETQGLPFRPVNLETVIDEVLASLTVLIQETGTQVQCNALPTLTVDRTQIAQVFQNLIENGIKYNRSKPPQVSITCKRQEEAWMFAVADNGIGIDPKHHERIFQIFHRLHTYDQVQGAGIGLALCRRIVERHGGHIWVESQPEQGSTFYFTLPASREVT